MAKSLSPAAIKEWKRITQTHSRGMDKGHTVVHCPYCKIAGRWTAVSLFLEPARAVRLFVCQIYGSEFDSETLAFTPGTPEHP